MAIGCAALLAAADVVLEGSRPAALIRRGLGPADIPARPGRVWLRITGYGTDAASADRVAFGDDAAVAGGLIGYDDAGPVFVGDAIADPLTGLEAAAAVRASVGRGGGELIEVAMAAVAASYAAEPRRDRTSSPNRCRRPCSRRAPRRVPTPRPSNGWSPSGWPPKSPAPHADHRGEPAGRCGRRHPRRPDDHGGRRAAGTRAG